jgi:hypothetical protein
LRIRGRIPSFEGPVHETEGLPCPAQLDNNPSSYNCPEHVFEAFYTPASNRLLNYDSYSAITALQLMKDRNNPSRFEHPVPAGSSQLSHLPGQEGDDDWNFPMEEL